MSDQSTQDQLEFKMGDKSASLKTSNLNTVATVACLCLSIVIAIVLYGHTIDTKDASKDLASAMRDMTQAAREQNCLISLPQERREQNAEICKRITR